ncbi:hypothetical protein MKX03_010012 [Papaver bracteatum]|nr:hypothetical protein MKX03_010012 [Papaver bracteatum]
MDAAKLITTKKMFLFFVGCTLLIDLHECNLQHMLIWINCNEMKCADQLPCWCCYERSKGTFCLATEDSCKTVCRTIPPATHN